MSQERASREGRLVRSKSEIGVVLTGGAEEREIAALMEAGAVACLTKDHALDEIAGAIRTAARSLGAARVVAGE